MAELKATKRDGAGTRVARRLRKKGQVPGIVYGHGETPQTITVTKHDLDLVIHHGDRLLELDVDGRKEHVLVKDVQYDAMQHDAIHVDLTRVSLDERVKVTVPIRLRGTPAGAVDGGVVSQNLAQASVECLVTAIPDDIRVSVAEMKIGDAIRVKDLPLPQGVKLLDDPEAIVCSVTKIAEEVVAAPAAAEGEAAAGAEPEVIGEKKEEEAAEGEAAEAPKKEKKEEKKE
ncbi:MAG: 50S ribosomal protein L25 [Phycisphaerae bacterium]